jgi:hypothetical protein
VCRRSTPALALLRLCAELLGYLRMPDRPKSERPLPDPPRLPQRAAIYIAPDGSVKFGALFEDLIAVAESISGKPLRPKAP